ncbi:MAG: four helix bundle protein [Acidobacteria bacterium]|nr:four helix bundle protein [Acidobacteriota bacterium]
MPLAHYRELIVWQKSVTLVTESYRLTANFPRHEIYGLTSQIRRSAASVPANIAEGQGRSSRGEFKQFLGHARGSLYELETHILVAHNLGYMPVADSSRLIANIHEIGKMLNGLLKSLDRGQAA